MTKIDFIRGEMMAAMKDINRASESISKIIKVIDAYNEGE